MRDLRVVKILIIYNLQVNEMFSNRVKAYLYNQLSFNKRAFSFTSTKVNSGSNVCTSSILFERGRLTLEKLKDKHSVDNSINHVLIAFPDQYGRLWSTEMTADYFLQKMHCEDEKE